MHRPSGLGAMLLSCHREIAPLRNLHAHRGRLTNMPVWPLLLRLLLAVALVFNGAAPAVAAVHAGHMAPRPMIAPPVAAAAAELPCHEHHQAGNADQAPATGGQPATPDCCESGVCRCHCVHSTPVAILDPGVVASVIEHAESGQPMATGHADAASQHLIRPPIG